MSEWPKEVIECLECGCLAMWWVPLWPKPCVDGGRHGPTQTVAVVPVSKLREAEAALADWEAFAQREATRADKLEAELWEAKK